MLDNHFLLPVNFVFQVDKLSLKEQMASILFKLGRFDESERIYRSLLFMNPDNYK
jgi:N-alpha-acetyltransferase 15/16, NatA auxiliary subunit